MIKKITILNEIALKCGQSLAQMTLSWVLKDDIVTCVLISASKLEQRLDNLQIIGHTKFSKVQL